MVCVVCCMISCFVSYGVCGMLDDMLCCQLWCVCSVFKCCVVSCYVLCCNGVSFGVVWCVLL